MKGNRSMVGSALRVVVVGGGIMGASAAWHLARRGAKVTLLEKRTEPAGGATRWSYGWVGTSSALPSESPSHFALQIEAVADFARLKQELGPLPVAARGALVWLGTEEETLRLISEQQAAGVHMEALRRLRVAEMEPRLAVPPVLAAWAPDDFAVEPIDLTRQFLAGAREAGAQIVCGAAAEAVETQGGRVAGVRTTKGVVAADVVILANAGSALPLIAALGMTLPIREEPAVLLRFAADARFLHHLLYGRGLELRPHLAGGLVSAADYPSEGEAGLTDLATRTAAIITDMFTPSPNPSLLSFNACNRPVTDDGSPICQFLPGVAGLYAIVAHPGVILAPYLGRLAAHDLVGA